MRSYPRSLDWLRYLSAFLLFQYGVSKVLHLQFALSQALAHRPVVSLTGYELTWYYYGYSRVYAWVLGLTQIVGAALLLFRKTAVLGAMTMLPVIVNILLIDLLILPPDYGPTIPALVIFSTTAALLWRAAPDLLRVTFTAQAPEPSRTAHVWIRTLIVVAVLAMNLVGMALMRRYAAK
jgi:hypothetical protein